MNEERKRKLSESLKEYYRTHSVSDATRAKISAKSRLYKPAPETVEKQREAWTQEKRLAMSQLKSGVSRKSTKTRVDNSTQIIRDVGVPISIRHSADKISARAEFRQYIRSKYIKKEVTINEKK